MLKLDPYFCSHFKNKMSGWSKIGLELVIVKQLWWIHGAHYSSLCTCVYVGNFTKQRVKNLKNKSEEILKRGDSQDTVLGEKNCKLTQSLNIYEKHHSTDERCSVKIKGNQRENVYKSKTKEVKNCQSWRSFSLPIKGHSSFCKVKI